MLDTGAVTRGSGSKNEDKERNIRKWFVDQDLIDGVILLPDNLFYNTPAAGVIIVLSKRKPAARKGQNRPAQCQRVSFRKGKPKNYLPEEDIHALALMFLKGEPVESELTVIDNNQAEDADYNLSPSRWVGQTADPEVGSIPTLIRTLKQISDEEARVTSDLLRLLHPLATLGAELFSRGLHGEPQKETDIGLLPESWEVVSLGSLGKVGNGSTPKKSIASYWEGGTYPWLTSAKVYERDIVAADQFVTERALAECHLPRIAPGAILIAITGQGKTLGHCAVLKTEATVSQHIAYVATDTERADPHSFAGISRRSTTTFVRLHQAAAARRRTHLRISPGTADSLSSD